MCGRYTLTLDERLLREIFDAALEGEFEPNYNICPGSEVPVILQDSSQNSSQQRRARLMRWGLIPRWAKGASVGYKMINARAETAHAKPAYKGPYQSQRCLVPADGFYEWQKHERGKTPFRITLPGAKPFAFAGLWDKCLSPEGEEILSFTILTIDASTAIRDIHNRMPVILAEDPSRDLWLDLNTPVNELKELLAPYTGELVAYRVSTLVNSPRNNFPELIKGISFAP